jgi:hypothetical protein
MINERYDSVSFCPHLHQMVKLFSHPYVKETMIRVVDPDSLGQI